MSERITLRLKSDPSVVLPALEFDNRQRGWAVGYESFFSQEDWEPVPPPYKLPTEPGLYRVHSKAADDVEGVLRLYEDGRWQWLGNKYNAAPEGIRADEVIRYHAPLTRLVPEAAS